MRFWSLWSLWETAVPLIRVVILRCNKLVLNGESTKIYFLDDLIWVRKATVILCYPWCSIHSSVFLMLHEFSVQAGLWSFIGEFLIWASQKKPWEGNWVTTDDSFLYLGHRMCMVRIVKSCGLGFCHLWTILTNLIATKLFWKNLVCGCNPTLTVNVITCSAFRVDTASFFGVLWQLFAIRQNEKRPQ